MSENNPWFGLALGILLIVDSALSLPETGGKFGGFTIPVFGGWVLLVIGIILVLLSARSLLRGGGKERHPTEEEIQEAEKALQRIHLREHGTLPEYPEGRPESPEEAKDSEKREQTR